MKRFAATLALLLAASCGKPQGISEAAQKALTAVDELRKGLTEHTLLQKERARLQEEISRTELSTTDAERAKLHQRALEIETRLREVVGAAQKHFTYLQGVLDAQIAENPQDGELLDARSQFYELMPHITGDESPDMIAKALADAEAALKLLPRDRPLLVRRAGLLRKVSRYEEAAAGIDEVLRDDPANASALAIRGLIHLSMNEFDPAAARLEEALKGKDRLSPSLLDEAQESVEAARKGRELWTAELKIREAEAKSDDLPRVKIVTDKGDILVELFENEAPNAVASFIDLCSKEFYNKTKFHRIVGDFMVQGGDPNSRDNDPRNDGQGGPGYRFADELGEKHRKHFRGSLSLANNGPDTNGSQFFLTYRPTSHLDGKHVVFGRVIEGLDVVHKLAAGDAIRETQVVRKRNHPYRPTVE